MNESTSPRDKLLVTSSPHMFAADSVTRIMWEVNLALLPALLIGWYVFGPRALVIIALSIAGAIAGEVLVRAFFLGKPVTIYDGSAILTGLLLGFCLPSALPAWIAFIGGFVATIFGKQVYGGLGQNIFNPAHVARAILLASWPVYMTSWVKPLASVPAWGALNDGVTAATPLGFLKETAANPELMTSLKASGTALLDHVFTTLHLTWGDMFLGTMGGSIGETGKLALILGGIFLLYRGHITWHAPVTMMATVFLGALCVTGDLRFAFFHLFSGGLIIGALFMVSDMVTAPVTGPGRLLFGFGCGFLTLLIRMKGGYPEGVCYSILIMNAFVPLIDRYIVPKRFGTAVSPALQEVRS
ncbi:MAG: RnfABCDGE type electron transport complex subunit D [Candidatus Ozemobacteraceae bacterium]